MTGPARPRGRTKKGCGPGNRVKQLCKVTPRDGNLLMSDESASQSTRPSLLMRLRDAGDAGAWATFVDVYTPLVYGYLRRRGLQDADAADVAQEVMTEVARSIRAFEYQ